jgi:hypothetical protein
VKNLANPFAFIKTLINNDNLTNILNSIQGYHINNNSNTSFVGVDVMRMNTFGRELNICQMPWKK